MKRLTPLYLLCLTFPLIAQVSATEAFLSQASLQLQAADRHQVDRLGPEQWFDAQVRLAPQLTEAGLDDYLARAGMIQATKNQLTEAWQTVTSTAADQLRQRMAFTLSRHFALQDDLDWTGETFALAHCYDEFLLHAFSNYEELLFALALHPVVARSAGHLNNNWNNGLNETFAHRLLSEWTIGREERFTREDVQQLALVFTGLGAGELTEFAYLGGYEGPAFGQPYTAMESDVRMKLYEDFHESGAKRVLGTILPSGRRGLDEIRAALRLLIRRPATATHVSRSLIRHWLQAEPQAGFVERVAAVFRDNGQGEWGDLRAVAAAILLDPELRHCPQDALELPARYRAPASLWESYLPSLPATEAVIETDCGWTLVDIDLEISPNPVAATTWIAIGEEAPGRNARLRIFNPAGRQLWAGIMRAGQRSLAVDVSGWPPSLYYVQFEEGAFRGMGRFVKS